MTWDYYTRQGLDLASTATSFGFTAAKTGTRLGFSVARGIAHTAFAVTGAVVDHTLFRGSSIASPVLGGAVTTVISLAEQITLAPLHLGEYITTTSLLAAHGSINVLSVILPGSSEASFSLASFITLVKREWNSPTNSASLPTTQFGIIQVAKAIVGWVALQGVTQEWQEKRWFKSLREINVNDNRRSMSTIRQRRGSRIRVTSDLIFPGNSGQIIAADIGDMPARAFNASSRWKPSGRIPNEHLKTTLRRLSKLVLAGYGGASLLFFGVSPHADAAESPARPGKRADKDSEQYQLARAINASEAEAAGEPSEVDDASESVGGSKYSWWDVLLGKHDHEIFERAANSMDSEAKAKAQMRTSAVIGLEHLMPRFWVLTDHGRSQIVLVLRGTMSLNEIAVDLTCDPEEFEPAITVRLEGDETPVPGQYSIPFPSVAQNRPTYHVHGGMLRMARAMGDIGKPVQLAVQEALYKNPGYELVLCGHSLGAGVAGILGMMWADPETCLTVRSSGLPLGRKVSVYCFAPPCLMDASLSRLANKIIVSFVYSHDIVSRLSLGSVRDLKNAAMWLCDANEAKGEKEDGAGYAGVTARARRWKAGEGSPDDPDWFVAVRKTLEANMQMADLYPPGRVLWALRDSDLHPSHRSHRGTDEKLRLFDVLDVEKVFSQIVFSRDMLSAHMPHQYDRVLHDLL
ncbi:hypothetical protein PC9H_005551 [Pleurotus ostreatus]|uniref:sn-1-specific diacylglycerol lipase n=1 Tax=Pleurotus ostreatus TaxID=5322 RepID=A0A8H6ZWP7_PLEOS|nr:uncharacterized protein PC9H_005551 [Pleurotus ostreatus]KAF7433590.1 hypothetical protein PC9H_005551 [Pleurotus ostreatus]